MEGFEEDENGALIAEVGDITVAIGVHRDMVSMEQPGDNSDGVDIIMLWNLDQTKELIAKLQAFVDSQ